MGRRAFLEPFMGGYDYLENLNAWIWIGVTGCG